MPIPVPATASADPFPTAGGMAGKTPRRGEVGSNTSDDEAGKRRAAYRLPLALPSPGTACRATRPGSGTAEASWLPAGTKTRTARMKAAKIRSEWCMAE